MRTKEVEDKMIVWVQCEAHPSFFAVGAGWVEPQSRKSVDFGFFLQLVMREVNKRKDQTCGLRIENSHYFLEFRPDLRAGKASWASKVNKDVFVSFFQHKCLERVSVESSYRKHHT